VRALRSSQSCFLRVTLCRVIHAHMVRHGSDGFSVFVSWLRVDVWWSEGGWCLHAAQVSVSQVCEVQQIWALSGTGFGVRQETPKFQLAGGTD